MDYWYHCHKDMGGCGHEFSTRKSIESRHEVECPCCGAWGGHVKKNGRRVVEIFLPTPPNISVDISSQDGRINDAVHMPAFGKDVYLTSRSQLRDLQKDAREKIMESTGGKKVLNVTDPDTGRREKVTVEREALDVGEIHTAESRPQPIDHGGQARQKVMQQILKEASERGVAPR